MNTCIVSIVGHSQSIKLHLLSLDGVDIFSHTFEALNDTAPNCSIAHMKQGGG